MTAGRAIEPPGRAAVCGFEQLAESMSAEEQAGFTVPGRGAPHQILTFQF